MNQDNNDELQKAINEITQNAANNQAATNTNPATPIVEPRNMTNNPAAPLAPAPTPPVPAGMDPAPANLTPNPLGNSGTTPSLSPEPTATDNPEITQVKEQILRELSPLLPKTKMEPEQKFKVYHDMIETLHDNSNLMPAFDTAKQIQDEDARAKALLELVTAIDEMGIK